MTTPGPSSPELPHRAAGGASFALSLAGVPVRVSCESVSQRRALERLWQQLFLMGEACGGPGIELELKRGRAAPSVTARVFSSDALDVHRSDAGFVLENADCWLEADVTAGRGHGVLGDDLWRLDRYSQREFFLVALMMMLRPHGRYGLHANALARNGRGLLLVGSSGSGKTTLALGLMQQGWSLLSDDAVALGAAHDAVDVYAFRRGVSCTEETEASFPLLREAPTLYVASDKRVRDIQALLPTSTAPRCRPTLIVFPRVADLARSALEVVSPLEALIGATRHSAGILSDRALSSRQLDVIKRLAEQAPGYRLALGQDALTHPERVSDLLIEAAGAHRA